jgi:hypothetical protein
VIHGAILNVTIEVESSAEFNRIFVSKSSNIGTVVSGAIVIESRVQGVFMGLDTPYQWRFNVHSELSDSMDPQSKSPSDEAHLARHFRTLVSKILPCSAHQQVPPLDGAQRRP